MATTTGAFRIGFGSTARERALDLITPTAAIAVPLQYAYIFLFNHTPEAVRLGMALVLLLVHVTLATSALSRRLDVWQAAILAAAAIMILCWMVAHGANPKSTPFSITFAVRDLSILVMPLWLLTFPERLPHRMILMLAIGSIILGGIIAFLGPAVFVSGTARLASITGGPLQMHASAMFIALQVILLTEYYRGRQLFGAISWPVTAFAAVVLIGYGGRNEFVILAAYVAALGYFRYSHVPAGAVVAAGGDPPRDDHRRTGPDLRPQRPRMGERPHRRLAELPGADLEPAIFSPSRLAAALTPTRSGIRSGGGWRKSTPTTTSCISR
ncbi:MAG: hypothetical protein U1E33_08820 [Rhodospirillales bacterium]